MTQLVCTPHLSYAIAHSGIDFNVAWKMPNPPNKTCEVCQKLRSAYMRNKVKWRIE
jgi:hypothetical protein